MPINELARLLERAEALNRAAQAALNAGDLARAETAIQQSQTALEQYNSAIHAFQQEHLRRVGAALAGALRRHR